MARTKEELLDLLATERRNLLAQLNEVPAALREQRPAADRWSVAEVTDHLGTVEEGVAKLITLKGAAPPSGSPDPSALAAATLGPGRIARLRSRDERIEAPERVRPGEHPPFDAALARIHASRSALERAVAAADDAALAAVTWTHQTLGTLTLNSWIEFVAHHEARHAEQIREIADSLRANAGA